MSPVTAKIPDPRFLDFQSTNPLSERALVALEMAFSKGWLDPSKLHSGSAKVRNLLEEARESIAKSFGVAKGELEFVGELGFGYWAALSGLLQNPETLFIHSEIDRQVVHAFAREHRNRGGRSTTLPVTRDGIADFSSALSSSNDATIFWQSTNRESGISQARSQLALAASRGHSLIVDQTATSHPETLPEDWSVALWDPRSFSGPEGIAILAIREGSKWRSPIPQIDKRRLFGAYSKPLLLLTALALEDYFVNHRKNLEHLTEMNSYLSIRLPSEIPGLQIAGAKAVREPQLMALVIESVVAEEVLRNLEKNGILVDAGSACGAGALAPSHVLSAMGFGVDGHIRITLRPEHTKADLDLLVEKLKRAVLIERDETTVK